MVLFTKHHSTFMSSETLSENKLATISSLKASNDVDLVRCQTLGTPLALEEQFIQFGNVFMVRNHFGVSVNDRRTQLNDLGV